MYKGRIETCAKRIETALSIRGMKQCELCEITDIPKSSLSLYLKGAYEPKQDRIYSISKALNVSEAWLMGYDVPMDRLSVSKATSMEVTENEQKLLELFRRVPESQQQMVLQMIEVALNTNK